MYLCNRKPKNQAIIIDAKNDGNDIPKTEKNKITLSKKVSLYNAEITPNINPKIKAIMIAETANIKVFLKVFNIISVTWTPVLTKDSLR